MRRAHPRHIRHALAFALLLALPTLTSGAESSSASYVLQQSTLNSAGTTSQGIGYRLSASLAQQTPVGASASAFAEYIVQSGFWSFVGSGLAPVFLTATHNPGNGANVDLSWTGSNAPYRIYQSTDCTSVFTGLFAATSDNSYSNIPPPPAVLVCYNVLATAPGP